mmetsp:Transcript_43868/g.68591  ORF Transcript_43868/g.68591 Transcript_43868/m.68591 type:complete len:327 (-) Transcript_43868:230-1210(-)
MGKISVFCNLMLIPITLIAIFCGYLQKEYKQIVQTLPRQEGKLAIITGASSGSLGYHTAVHLARAGAHVIMTYRTDSKGEQALSELMAEVPTASAEIMQLDLSNLTSVSEFSVSFKSKYPGKSINMLINNAGIMALPQREVSAQGYELQMATNHLGHFALTGLLLKSMAPKGRIINHSSGAHEWGMGHSIMEDLLSEASYSAWTAYGNSKLANLLFTYELNERLQAKKSDLVAVAVQPGYTATSLQDNTKFAWTQWAAMQPKDGSLPQVVAATDASISPSDKTYVGPAYAMWGPPAALPTKDFAWNATNQDALWAKSQELTGIKFW